LLRQYLGEALVVFVRELINGDLGDEYEMDQHPLTKTRLIASL
jgi:hypothetical protein